MIDVYYPYIEHASVWHELRYSLRSLETHLKTPFRVVIIGDKPQWLTNVYHIPAEPVVNGAENCLRDTLNKLSIYLSHGNVAEKFIRMYDDSYMVNDVYMEHFAKARAMYQFRNMPNTNGIWWDQLRRTAKALHNIGFNTETHFPELFETQLMQDLFDFYEPHENLLLVSSLYYNTYFENKDILPQDKVTGDGAKFYGKQAVNNFNFSPDDDVEQCCNNKLFLNHNNAGLTDKLKGYLMDKFPKKSMYEV